MKQLNIAVDDEVVKRKQKTGKTWKELLFAGLDSTELDSTELDSTEEVMNK
jgi:hypothetical protein